MFTDFIIGLIIIIIFVFGMLFFLLDTILEKTSVEVLLFGLLFVITGGVFIFEPYLPKNIFIVNLAYALIIFGLIAGIIGFKKE